MDKIIKSNTQLVSWLLHSQQQAHIFHLSTTSFAQHKALENYYTTIGNLLDSYAETFQGRYSLLRGYTTYPIQNDPKKSINYFENLLKIINSTKIPTNATELHNILDTIHELVNKTLYLLKYLN